MKFDKEMLSKLLSLDETSFREKVMGAAQASGINDPRLETALKDVNGLKKTLSGLSEDEVKKVVTMIGAERADEILSNLKKKID